MRTLFPQYTIRLLLVVTAACAVVFSIAGLALRGHTWAAGVSVAVGSLVIALMVYAVLFGVVWTISLVAESLTSPPSAGGSPFAPAGAATDPAGGSPFAPAGTAAEPPGDEKDGPDTLTILD